MHKHTHSHPFCSTREARLLHFEAREGEPPEVKTEKSDESKELTEKQLLEKRKVLYEEWQKSPQMIQQCVAKEKEWSDWKVKTEEYHARRGEQVPPEKLDRAKRGIADAVDSRQKWEALTTRIAAVDYQLMMLRQKNAGGKKGAETPASAPSVEKQPVENVPTEQPKQKVIPETPFAATYFVSHEDDKAYRDQIKSWDTMSSKQLEQVETAIQTKYATMKRALIERAQNEGGPITMRNPYTSKKIPAIQASASDNLTPDKANNIFKQLKLRYATFGPEWNELNRQGIIWPHLESDLKHVRELIEYKRAKEKLPDTMQKYEKIYERLTKGEVLTKMLFPTKNTWENILMNALLDAKGDESAVPKRIADRLDRRFVLSIETKRAQEYAEMHAKDKNGKPAPQRKNNDYSDDVSVIMKERNKSTFVDGREEQIVDKLLKGKTDDLGSDENKTVVLRKVISTVFYATYAEVRDELRGMKN